jgi:metal-sulfur cluster biosynthetic enzyme
MINENPIVYDVQERVERKDDWTEREEILSPREIFELIRHITDPEHPLTLEQLNVVQEQLITIDYPNETVMVNFTPTIPHCSMSTLIGLCIRVQLLRCLHPKWKVDIRVTPGSHQSEDQVNKQLNDKERVCAALENQHLLSVCNNCLKSTVDKINT